MLLGVMLLQLLLNLVLLVLFGASSCVYHVRKDTDDASGDFVVDGGLLSSPMMSIPNYYQTNKHNQGLTTILSDLSSYRSLSRPSGLSRSPLIKVPFHVFGEDLYDRSA